jgi:hypothetical protein
MSIMKNFFNDAFPQLCTGKIEAGPKVIIANYRCLGAGCQPTARGSGGMKTI